MKRHGGAPRPDAGRLKRAYEDERVWVGDDVVLFEEGADPVEFVEAGREAERRARTRHAGDQRRREAERRQDLLARLVAEGHDLKELPTLPDVKAAFGWSDAREPEYPDRLRTIRRALKAGIGPHDVGS